MYMYIFLTYNSLHVQYPDKTLEEILEELKPYSGLSVSPLVREDIITKVRALTNICMDVKNTMYIYICKLYP